MRGLVRAAIAGVIAIGSVVGLSLPAQAATPPSCTSTGNGQLCLSIINGDDYQASYKKTSGAVAYVDFTLYCTNGTWFGDGGAFYIGAGQTKTYIFTIGNHGSCYLVMYDRGGGKLQWQTGLVSP